MSQLSWMITITDRKKAPDFVALYQQQNIMIGGLLCCFKEKLLEPEPP